MNSRRYRKRMSVERDRLSSLPNDLIHKIFSYIGIKDVVKTSILSSKWRFIWTSMPYLNFSSNEFSSLLKFSESVTRVLSHRNNQIEVESVNLSLNGRVSQVFVKRTLDYAFSHNVQRMTIACLPEKKIRFPISLFTSHSVKYLTIIRSTIDRLTPTSTWELPALTTLHLENVTLYDEDDYDDNVDCDLLFSKCSKLKTLTLNNCNIMGSHGFNICHLQLTKLTLMNGNWGWELVNVVAPKLENLTIVNCDSVHLNSVPELTSLIYGSRYSFQVSADGLPSLENVDVCIAKPCEADVYEIVRLLQQLQSVKFLTLNLEIIELLSSSVEVISDQPSPFVNLTSLKICPANLDYEEQLQNNYDMSSEVRNYLLDGSPNAVVTLFSREEIRAVRYTTMAQNLMAELWLLIEQEKSKTDGAHVDQEKEKICDIVVSKLQYIDVLLKKLPTSSNRTMMEACFSSLLAEADLFLERIDHASI